MLKSALVAHLEVSAILKDDFVADIYQVDSDLGSIRLLEI
jgi:hypothetical protein